MIRGSFLKTAMDGRSFRVFGPKKYFSNNKFRFLSMGDSFACKLNILAFKTIPNWVENQF